MKMIESLFMIFQGTASDGHIGIDFVAANCSDINECLAEVDPCTSPNSVQICQNLDGAFTCLCGPGFEGPSYG